jgi:hypothetical protein
MRTPEIRSVGLCVALLCRLAGGAAVLCSWGPAAARKRNLDLSAAQRQIEAREYWASRTAEGLQAPNRRHDLRAWFDSSGIRVQDRSARGSQPLLSLQLTRVGRGDALASVGTGEVSSRRERVEIRHARVVEWYVNSAAGLEQGFTFPADPAPAARDSSQPLVLELEVGGASVARGADGLAFATDSGRVLHYGGLVARDAGSREVAAAFEIASESRVRISVDDRDALYPIVIDPLLTETPDAQVTSPAASPGDGLGESVASVGDVNGDGYDDVIVGAPYFDGGQYLEGAAFVFLGSADGIASGEAPATAAAQLESDQALALMGSSVAGAGDVNGDGYDDVIVGAYPYDSDPYPSSAHGAAYVFLGSASGIADGNPTTAHARLLGEEPVFHFGESVASAGDVDGDGYGDVIIGAPSRLVEETSAAFVFHGSAQGIADGGPATAQTVLLSTAPDDFGFSVAGAGDVNGDGYDDVLVGAPAFAGGTSEEGATYLYLGSAAGIADGGPADAAAHWESGHKRALFGESVAGAGDVNGDGYADVIIGSYRYSDFDFLPYGAAFLFLGSAQGIASGPASSAVTQLRSPQLRSWFGRNVASAGDVNADGYSDVLVSGHGWKTGGGNQGAVFLYLGSPSGIPSRSPGFADLQLDIPVFAGEWSVGLAVASAGDVNADGCDDVIIGAESFGTVAASEGAAFVYQGDVQIIPEPSHLALLVPGIALLWGLSRRRVR